MQFLKKAVNIGKQFFEADVKEENLDSRLSSSSIPKFKKEDCDFSFLNADYVKDLFVSKQYSKCVHVCQIFLRDIENCEFEIPPIRYDEISMPPTVDPSIFREVIEAFDLKFLKKNSLQSLYHIVISQCFFCLGDVQSFIYHGEQAAKISSYAQIYYLFVLLTVEDYLKLKNECERLSQMESNWIIHCVCSVLWAAMGNYEKMEQQLDKGIHETFLFYLCRSFSDFLRTREFVHLEKFVERDEFLYFPEDLKKIESLIENTNDVRSVLCLTEIIISLTQLVDIGHQDIEQQDIDSKLNKLTSTFETLLEAYPSYFNYNFKYAVLLAKYSKENKKSADYFKNALEINPKNPIAHFNYAILLKNCLTEGNNASYDHHFKVAERLLKEQNNKYITCQDIESWLKIFYNNPKDLYLSSIGIFSLFAQWTSATIISDAVKFPEKIPEKFPEKFSEQLQDIYPEKFQEIFLKQLQDAYPQKPSLDDPKTSMVFVEGLIFNLFYDWKIKIDIKYHLASILEYKHAIPDEPIKIIMDEHIKIIENMYKILQDNNCTSWKVLKIIGSNKHEGSDEKNEEINGYNNSIDNVIGSGWNDEFYYPEIKNVKTWSIEEMLLFLQYAFNGRLSKYIKTFEFSKIDGRRLINFTKEDCKLYVPDMEDLLLIRKALIEKKWITEQIYNFNPKQWYEKQKKTDRIILWDMARGIRDGKLLEKEFDTYCQNCENFVGSSRSLLTILEYFPRPKENKE